MTSIGLSATWSLRQATGLSHHRHAKPGFSAGEGWNHLLMVSVIDVGGGGGILLRILRRPTP